MEKQPNERAWGPWVLWGKRRPPDGLSRHRFQAVYINKLGDLMNDATDGRDRYVHEHVWFFDGRPGAVTLAYRIEIRSRVEPPRWDYPTN